MPYTDFHWIRDNLAIGGIVAESAEMPFDAILSMETHAPTELRDLVTSGQVDYQWRSIMDGICEEDHDAIVGRFDAAAAQLRDWVQSGKRVLVHCWAGVSRSVTAVIWYLMRYEGYSWDAALALVQSQRTIANPNIRFEIPLRIANGERLSECWLQERIESYCRRLLEDYEIEVDPAEIRQTLERQGSLRSPATVAP